MLPFTTRHTVTRENHEEETEVVRTHASQIYDDTEGFEEESESGDPSRKNITSVT